MNERPPGPPATIADLCNETEAVLSSGETSLMSHGAPKHGHHHHSGGCSTPTFTTIDDPSAASNTTILSGITAKGVIYGSYADSSNHFHGFTDSHGTFAAIPIVPSGMNSGGTIVGGDTIYANGTITTYQVPIFDTTGTRFTAINDHDVMVGNYFSHLMFEGSFTLDNGTFTPFTVPGARATEARALNDQGVIVGNYADPWQEHGFIYNNGAFTAFDIPGETSVMSINGIDNAGDMVGAYSTTNPYIGDTHGFLYSGGELISFDYPGAKSTTASGVNHGEVVGSYTMASGDTHGFEVPLRELLAAASASDLVPTLTTLGPSPQITTASVSSSSLATDPTATAMASLHSQVTSTS